jgi:hypothetical protein
VQGLPGIRDRRRLKFAGVVFSRACRGWRSARAANSVFGFCVIKHFQRVNLRIHLLGRTDSLLLRVTGLAGMVRTLGVGGVITMKKAGLLFFIFAASCYPAVAKHHNHHREAAMTSHSRISCETVRAYVAQVGLAQAKAMAQAAGMSETEERQARQCLEKKI